MREKLVKVPEPERGDVVFHKGGWGVVAWFNPRRKMCGLYALPSEKMSRDWDKLTDIPNTATIEMRLINMTWRTDCEAWEVVL